MDEDIDKTGYSKLKTDALCKAFQCCARVTEITIGPDACPSTGYSENDSELPCTKTSQRKSLKSGYEIPTCDVVMMSLKEKEEDKYCAKKLLAELNKICAIGGQRIKVDKLKKRLEKLERAQQDADRMVACEEADALKRRQQRQYQVDSIQNQLVLKQQQLSSSTFVSRDFQSKKISEIKNQNEKEKSSEKKVLYDAIYKNEVEFKNAYSETVDMIRNYKGVKQAIAADVDMASKINAKYISLIEHCKVREITQTDVDLSFSLLKDIRTINSKIKNEKDKFEAFLEIKKQEEERQKVSTEHSIKIIDKEIVDEITPIKTEIKEEEISPRCNYMEKYHSLMTNLTEIEQKLKPFIADESFKKYRSDCQKAVNLPVNAISPCSAAHLTDKLKKLTQLLQGQTVTVADRRVSSSAHPLGLIYCTNLLAEKIVKQGEQVVSSKPDAAFAIAAVTVALWIEFSNFGQLLLAHFYRRCPYLIPAYWEREENQTEEEYYKKLGFIYSGGSVEEFNMFLKRQGGIVKLYSSIMIADKKISHRIHDHPLGLGQGWRLLAAFIKLDPKPEISATVLLDILEIVGDAMVKAYGNQFHKLLHVICKSYVPKIVDITAEGMNGGPLCRLRNFLECIAKGKVLQPPKGVLPPNFW